MINVLCEKCLEKETCMKLCKEAEAYANLDKVSWPNEWVLTKDNIENFSNEDEIDWNTDEVMEEESLKNVAATTMAQLGGRKAQVVDLYFNSHLTYAQVASTLGISKGTVQGYLKRSYKKLFRLDAKRKKGLTSYIE